MALLVCLIYLRAPGDFQKYDTTPRSRIFSFVRPQQVDLWVRVLHVCVGTAACPWTADVRPCAPQAKIKRFAPFYLKKLHSKFSDFLTIWWKAPFWLVENQKKKMDI
jgi:hypothetical protein